MVTGGDGSGASAAGGAAQPLHLKQGEHELQGTAERQHVLSKGLPGS